VTVLELDHVFCIVTDPGQAAQRLEDDGWALDGGQAHSGQGTQNRRLVWPEQFFELLWIADAARARTNALRLDRRADWNATGASRIHRDNDRSPERPLVFVLETTAEQMRQRRLRGPRSEGVAHRRPGELREVRVRGPSAPSLPAFAGPPIVYLEGPHLLELVVDGEGSARPVSDTLVIRS
jgi:hypothetical protein